MIKTDIDNLRKAWELDDHWLLRKAFLEVYCDQFPDDKLLCLAQTFVNIETLGVAYAQDVMEEIGRLGEKIPYLTEYRAIKERRDSESSERKKIRKETKTSAAQYAKLSNKYGFTGTNFEGSNNYGNQGYGQRNQSNYHNRPQGGYGYNSNNNNNHYQNQRSPRNQSGPQQNYQQAYQQYPQNNHNNPSYQNRTTRDYNHQYSGRQGYKRPNDIYRDDQMKRPYEPPSAPSMDQPGPSYANSGPAPVTYGYSYNNIYSQPQSYRGSVGPSHNRPPSNAPPKDVYQRARRY